MESFLPRGLKIEKHRAQSLKAGIKRLPTPPRLVLPLPGCEAASLRLVKPGDQIATGQLLSVPTSAAPVSAPSGGTVVDVITLDLPFGGPTPCAVINCTAGKKAVKAAPIQKELTPELIVRVAEAAGIIDEFDGKPLYKKLSRMRRAQISLLIACAIDDDIYATSSAATLREDPENVATGLELAALAVGAAERKIAVADSQDARAVKKERPQEDLLVAGNRYPARLLLLRRLRRSGLHPAYVGAQACLALARAVKDGRAQTGAVVTVAGDSVKSPCNIYAPIGAAIGDLLKLCGCKAPEFVYVGSAAAGRQVRDLSLPVTANTRCITALTYVPRHNQCACIGCGRCARVCPRGITPWRVYEELQREKPDPLHLANVQNCGGCAACSMTCPSAINLAEVIAQAAVLKKSGDFE